VNQITLGLWALRQGLNQPYPRSARLSKVFIGPVKKPVMFVKRHQVKYFLDEWFFSAYDLWRKFNMGLGLPYAGGWADNPAHVVAIIEAFETENRAMQRAGG